LLVGYSAQIFADFAGYTLIAIVDDPRRESVQAPALALGPLSGQPLSRERQSVRHPP
jgi:hypothetical protein